MPFEGSSYIADIVDLERYPIDQPDSPAGRELLASAQDTLARDALFSMPGFVRPDAVAAMASELEALTPVACRYEADREAWAGGDPSGVPADHPLFELHKCAYHQVLNYQISNASPLRTLYFWDPLMDFLRKAMGYQSFHRSECPHLALTSKIASEGDTDGWHFDGNDVVFSVLLQAPEAGGQFEYVPHIRIDEGDLEGDYAAVFDGTHGDLRRPAAAPGDFNVFKGNQSIHRVSPVQGARQRIIALFSYDQSSGTTFDEPYIDHLRRCTPPRVF